MASIDHDAERLYKQVEGGRIVKFYQQAMKAVETSAAKLEEFPNTPYTKENAETCAAAARAMHELGEELRAWHRLMWKE